MIKKYMCFITLLTFAFSLNGMENTLANTSPLPVNDKQSLIALVKKIDAKKQIKNKYVKTHADELSSIIISGKDDPEFIQAIRGPLYRRFGCQPITVSLGQKLLDNELFLDKTRRNNDINSLIKLAKFQDTSKQIEFYNKILRYCKYYDEEQIRNFFYYESQLISDSCCIPFAFFQAASKKSSTKTKEIMLGLAHFLHRSYGYPYHLIENKKIREDFFNVFPRIVSCEAALTFIDPLFRVIKERCSSEINKQCAEALIESPEICQSERGKKIFKEFFEGRI